jgi:hypothetical protein
VARTSVGERSNKPLTKSSGSVSTDPSGVATKTPIAGSKNVVRGTPNWNQMDHKGFVLAVGGMPMDFALIADSWVFRLSIACESKALAPASASATPECFEDHLRSDRTGGDDFPTSQQDSGGKAHRRQGLRHALRALQPERGRHQCGPRKMRSRRVQCDNGLVLNRAVNKPAFDTESEHVFDRSQYHGSDCPSETSRTASHPPG